MGVQDRDWYRDLARERNAWYNPKAFRGTRTIRSRIWKPLLLAALVGLVVGLWMGRFQAGERMQVTPAAARQEMPSARAVQEHDRELRRAELQRQELSRLNEIAERRRLDGEAAMTVQAAADRKAKAWARFYRPSEMCVDFATVECANRYIRAKREFEKEFASGRL